MNDKQLQDLGRKIGAGIVITILIGLCLWLIFAGIGKMLPKPMSPMSNDQIIYETKKCESAGMRSYTVLSTINGSTTRVICESKETKQYEK